MVFLSCSGIHNYKLDLEHNERTIKQLNLLIMEVIDQDQGNNIPLGNNKLPNSGATLALGIFSIFSCFCFAIPGLVLGIVALVISNQSVELYKRNPSLYSGYNEIQAGRITAIIGICLSGLHFLFYLMILGISGWSFTDLPHSLERFLNNL
jgi:hypothetical protein